MAALIIPLAAVASQTLSVLLAGQNCQIAIYQKTTGLFLDLSVNNAPIVTGLICRDRLSMTARPALAFMGDLFFKDMSGVIDPAYWGLGSRFLLCHMVAAQGY